MGDLRSFLFSRPWGLHRRGGSYGSYSAGICSYLQSQLNSSSSLLSTICEMKSRDETNKKKTRIGIPEEDLKQMPGIKGSLKPTKVQLNPTIRSTSKTYTYTIYSST